MRRRAFIAGLGKRGCVAGGRGLSRPRPRYALAG